MIEEPERKYLDIQGLANGTNANLITDEIKRIGKLCEQYKWSHEEEKLANDVKGAANMIVTYILKVKPVGDAIVKFDKSGYGKALPHIFERPTNCASI